MSEEKKHTKDSLGAGFMHVCAMTHARVQRESTRLRVRHDSFICVMIS